MIWVTKDVAPNRPMRSVLCAGLLLLPSFLGSLVLPICDVRQTAKAVWLNRFDFFRFNNKSKNCDRWPTNSFTCRMMAFGPRNRGHLLCHVTRYCEAGFSFWFLGVLIDKLPKQHNNSLQSECIYSANHSIRLHEACCWLMAVTLRRQRKQAHCVHNASLLFVG